MDHPDWRIFVACSLMNMTTGLTMRPYMWKLFDRWPTPHALASCNRDELCQLIRPLGFYNRRSTSLIAMSQEYLRGKWRTPHDLPGCGKYAHDSWLIFCKGEIPLIQNLKDKELRRYIHWLTTGEYIPQSRNV